VKLQKLRVGDWVEVRSKAEILSTLDENGELDGMPFMPEMLRFCGQRLQVFKRAHKTCDTVFPVRGRRVERTVHLDTRCDGSAHGGCEASCLLFWKEAWLKRVSTDPTAAPGEYKANGNCTEAAILAKTQRRTEPGADPAYSCQATRLPYATSDLKWWDLRQYIEDYTSGNVGIWRIVCGAAYSAYYKLSRAGIGLGPAMRWFYDTFHPLWRGTPFPRKRGMIPLGQPTPSANLSLKPGELVRIKPHREILKTINEGNSNRGLYFDAEEVPYCGKTYRVLRIVKRIIDERTGSMLHMKTPCVVLDSVICQSRYSECRMFCPRSIYPYWREIWLERVKNDSAITEETEVQPALISRSGELKAIAPDVRHPDPVSSKVHY
jgi:hypothetical protein